MKKESGKVDKKKKWVWIILIIVLLLVIIVVAGYFVMKSKGLSFANIGLDFSSGTNALAGIGKATDANSFDNVKLNPFENGTG